MVALHIVAISTAGRRALRSALFLQARAVLGYTPLLLCLMSFTAFAQQQNPARAVSSELPDAPSAVLDQQSSSERAPSPGGSASVFGVVLDASGAMIADAQVILTESSGMPQRNVKSGANGEFTFAAVPAGSYLVVVEANGFEAFTSTAFSVTAQQAYEVPKILLSIAMANTVMTIRPTEVIAAEQIKAEEKQRLIGIVPNFYTSYIYDAAPLTTKQKFSLTWRDTFDPTSFIGDAIGAGVEQANNSFSGYGQGATGYAKRYGALFVNGRTSDFLSHAVFPSIFHQDPRYYYQGSGSVKSRIGHAASFAFVTRSDRGHAVPNYSYLLGDLSSGALSNLYYPAANRGASLVFTNFAIGLGGRLGSNILREFLSKRFTTHVPGNGKPTAPDDGKP
jgi:Carboxypeptidase regulatory-like domain